MSIDGKGNYPEDYGFRDERTARELLDAIAKWDIRAQTEDPDVGMRACVELGCLASPLAARVEKVLALIQQTREPKNRYHSEYALAMMHVLFLLNGEEP